ncbi:MAG: hypothetical protein Q9220_006277 [cf. Caloplaca sp. 1 TL-2023]
MKGKHPSAKPSSSHHSNNKDLDQAVSIWIDLFYQELCLHSANPATAKVHDPYKAERKARARHLIKKVDERSSAWHTAAFQSAQQTLEEAQRNYDYRDIVESLQGPFEEVGRGDVYEELTNEFTPKWKLAQNLNRVPKGGPAHYPASAQEQAKPQQQTVFDQPLPAYDQAVYGTAAYPSTAYPSTVYPSTVYPTTGYNPTGYNPTYQLGMPSQPGIPSYPTTPFYSAMPQQLGMLQQPGIPLQSGMFLQPGISLQPEIVNVSPQTMALPLRPARSTSHREGKRRWKFV